MFETHAHLDYLKKTSIANSIEESLKQQVDKIITVSVDPSNLDTVIEISNKWDNVYCSQGIHPHDASKWSKSVEEKIINNCKKYKKIVALGEMGLDYHYDNSPRDIQKKVFETQLNLAVDLNLPVIIHSREAEEDTIDILKNFKNFLSKKGVFHSYSSNLLLAEFALSENFLLGFNGIITFNGAEEVRKVVSMTPIDKIVIETDAPFLTPVPHRGKENTPQYLPHILAKIAEIKNSNLEFISNQTYINSLKLFEIK